MKTDGQPMSLTSDPIPRLIWQIGIPASVGIFANALFNFIDTFCAGSLSTDALAALSLSFPLYFMLIAIGSGLSQGTTALLANAIGARDEVAARQIYAQSLLFASAAGVILSIAGYLTASHIFRFLGADGSYLNTTLSFMNVIFAGGTIFVLNMTINSALAAVGATRIYRNFLIVGCLSNCVLNPLLMWGLLGLPELGVSGIAMATVLVQMGGCAYLWRTVQQTALFSSLPINSFRPDFKVLKQIASQSVPAALNMVTIALGVFVITWFVKQFGKEAVAATGIASRIEQMILMPAIGLNSAMLSIVGQNHGAGLPKRVREAWLNSISYGVGLMILGGLIVGFFGQNMIGIFTNNSIVISHGSNYLKASSFTLAAYPILFATVFMMQGLRRPVYGLWIGLYRQVFAPLIAFQTFAITLKFGLVGIWWGFCLVTWSAALFALWWGWRVVHVPLRD